jgi:hypothetical protein
MKSSKFDEQAVTTIADCLFQTNMPLKEIASKIGRNEAYVKGVIKDMGWEWAQVKGRKMSRGAAALTGLFKQLMPGQKIMNEYHVGERLLLDVFCPHYNIGAEYHGSQHFSYTSFFHENKDDFIKAQIRDERKIELCKQQGITLVVFRYNDTLNEDIVSARILDAIRDSNLEPTKNMAKKKKPKNEFYEKQQQKRREEWRKHYRKSKKYLK